MLDELATIPPLWSALLTGYAAERQTIGRSEAATFKLVAPDRPALFIKTALHSPFSEIQPEAERLHWLATQRMPCPKVESILSASGRTWLLTAALPGRDLASSPDLAPAEICTIVADALSRLHDLDITACPFDQHAEARIALARARMDAGLVDEQDFDPERKGRTAADLFTELIARHPQREDLVVTHGDACLPNFIAEQGRFTGFVDCARLGIADRHQDLALAARSIAFNLGENWVPPFLDAYGIVPDPDRMAFYRLLDEFF